MSLRYPECVDEGMTFNIAFWNGGQITDFLSNPAFLFLLNGERKTLVKQLTQMLDDAKDDEEFSILAKGVIEKVNGMTDQAFSKMSRDLMPDFDKDE